MNVAHEVAPEIFLNLDLSLTGTVTKLGAGGGKFELAKSVCDLLNQQLASFKTRKTFVAYDKKEGVSIVQTDKNVNLQNWQSRQGLVLSKKDFHGLLLRIGELYTLFGGQALESELDLFSTLFQEEEEDTTDDEVVEALCRKRMRRDVDGRSKAALRLRRRTADAAAPTSTTAAAAAAAATTTTRNVPTVVTTQPSATPVLESILKRCSGQE